MNDGIIYKLPGGWQIVIIEKPGCPGEALNFVLDREDKKYFEATGVEGKTPDGKTFFKPMFFEKGDPTKGKIGDVVITFRENPATHEWMVDIEDEEMFETKTTSKMVKRAHRSSVHNPDQAIERRVDKVGEVNSNPGRIGAPFPIFLHCVIAGWSPQLYQKGALMSVSDYVDTLDSMGQSTMLKTLKLLPEEIAYQIVKQIRRNSNPAT